MAQRQGIGRGGQPVAQIEGFDHLGNALAPGVAFQSVDAGREFQVLLHREQAVERKLLRHVAEPALGCAGGAAQIMAHHMRFASSWFQQAAQHLEGGGLAGAVRAEQAEDFALLHLEADVVGGGELAEALGEVSARHGNVGTQLNRRQTLGQRRSAAGAATEQIDEGVFEARGHLRQLHSRLIGQGLELLRLSALAQHHAHAGALDHAIAHGGQVECLGQDRSALGTDVFQTETAAFELRGQLLRRAIEQELPLVQQQHALAALGFVEIGGGPDHGHAFIGQRLHHAPQVLAADRVDTHARLVQQQHLRPRHERTGKAQLLLHAAGELAGQAFGEGSEPREVQQLGKQIGVAVRIHAAQLRIQAHVLHHRQVFVQAKALRHVATGDMNGVVVLDHVIACQGDVAGVRHQEAGQNPHQRRLAGAVGADQTRQPSIVDARAQAPQRLYVAEMLVHVFDDDGSGSDIRACACRRGGVRLHLNVPPRAR